MPHQALCIISKPLVNSNWSYSLETLNSGQNWQFFVMSDLEIWWITVKNNGVPFLYYQTLCIISKPWVKIQFGELQSGNAQFGSVSNFLSCVTLKFDGWPCKTHRTPLLYCIKLCASFQSHQWIKTWVAVPDPEFDHHLSDWCFVRH